MSKPKGHDHAALNTVVNRLRIELQDSTCCPVAAAQVATILLATFALDIAQHDPETAAREIELMAKNAARSVREGDIVLQRAAPAKDH